MEGVTGDFELTMDELRAVAAHAAQEVLPVFEDAVPGDRRPREAIDAAWQFATGARRTTLQRRTSLEAHRAAKAATSEIARLAAQAAGDAAAAAYLHPLAKAHQVGHILRASANAARIAEMKADGDPAEGIRIVEAERDRAPSVVIEVLRRYPPALSGRTRAAQLMAELDASLRFGS